jgi:hypothetical protein
MGNKYANVSVQATLLKDLIADKVMKYLEEYRQGKRSSQNMLDLLTPLFQASNEIIDKRIISDYQKEISNQIYSILDSLDSLNKIPVSMKITPPKYDSRKCNFVNCLDCPKETCDL